MNYMKMGKGNDFIGCNSCGKIVKMSSDNGKAIIINSRVKYFCHSCLEKKPSLAFHVFQNSIQ